MPPRKSPTLTQAELRLMEVLWDRGPSTVHQLLEDSAAKSLAYNSVLTTIRLLEKKGYVKHAKDGRAHVYISVMGRKEATKSEVRNLVSRFFQDSHELLLLNILEDKSIDAEELKRLAQLVEGRAEKP